jgi:hypothetical protein
VTDLPKPVIHQLQTESRKGLQQLREGPQEGELGTSRICLAKLDGAIAELELTKW